MSVRSALNHNVYCTSQLMLLTKALRDLQYSYDNGPFQLKNINSLHIKCIVNLKKDLLNKFSLTSIISFSKKKKKKKKKHRLVNYCPKLKVFSAF